MGVNQSNKKKKSAFWKEWKFLQVFRLVWTVPNTPNHPQDVVWGSQCPLHWLCSVGSFQQGVMG